jgi:hypothetical protein
MQLRQAAALHHAFLTLNSLRRQPRFWYAGVKLCNTPACRRAFWKLNSSHYLHKVATQENCKAYL